MQNFIIGLSLGIDNFFFNFLPLAAMRSIRLISLVSFLLLILNFKRIKLRTLQNKMMLGIFCWGIGIAICRYSLKYEDLLIMPIFRQAIAFLLGWTLLIVFRDHLAKTGLKNISFAIAVTSIPFLLLGIYQQCVGHLIGYFTRVISTFTEPSYFADYLILTICPFLIFCFSDFKNYSRNKKWLIISTSFLWFANLVFVQSGNAVLKLATLAFCFLLFYPMRLKLRLIIFSIVAAFVFFLVFIYKGYVNALLVYVLDIYNNPSAFFRIHTFYDRFFPIYAAIKNLFTIEGFLGLGFGGDYFEFKNLYPPSTHAVMLEAKPTLSFFNSFAGKVILYFGFLGLCGLLYLFSLGFKLKNSLLKVAYLNVLISSLWGIANFSLPYFWIWFAIVLNEIEFNRKDRS